MLRKQLLLLLEFAGFGLAQNSLTQVLGSTGNLSQLSGVFGLVSPLETAFSQANNVTFLAPSNEAFNALDNTFRAALAGNQNLILAVLQYHVLAGAYHLAAIPDTGIFLPSNLTDAGYANVTAGQVVELVRRNGVGICYSGDLINSTISTADIAYAGGMIQIIDRFLTLPQQALDTMSADGLTSLRGAINAAGLSNSLDTTRDLTIFAPLNKAWQNIGSSLNSLSTSQVSELLTYHVSASGTVLYSSNFKNNAQLRTMNGASLTITTGKGGVFVNNARIVTSDILLANGVLHVIDEVLNPTNTTTQSGTASQGAIAFSGASALSVAPFTSGVPTASSTIPVDVTTSIPSSSSVTNGPGNGPGTNNSNSVASMHSSLSKGAIAGIVIGTLPVLVLLGIFIFCLLRRKKKPINKSTTGNAYVDGKPELDATGAMRVGRGHELDGKTNQIFEMPEEKPRNMNMTAHPVLPSSSPPRSQNIEMPDTSTSFRHASSLSSYPSPANPEQQASGMSPHPLGASPDGSAAGGELEAVPMRSDYAENNNFIYPEVHDAPAPSAPTQSSRLAELQASRRQVEEKMERLRQFSALEEKRRRIDEEIRRLQVK